MPTPGRNPLSASLPIPCCRSSLSAPVASAYIAAKSQPRREQPDTRTRQRGVPRLRPAPRTWRSRTRRPRGTVRPGRSWSSCCADGEEEVLHEVEAARRDRGRRDEGGTLRAQEAHSVERHQSPRGRHGTRDVGADEGNVRAAHTEPSHTSLPSPATRRPESCVRDHPSPRRPGSRTQRSSSAGLQRLRAVGGALRAELSVAGNRMAQCRGHVAFHRMGDGVQGVLARAIPAHIVISEGSDWPERRHQPSMS